jgi:hypothetical protein
MLVGEDLAMHSTTSLTAIRAPAPVAASQWRSWWAGSTTFAWPAAATTATPALVFNSAPATARSARRSRIGARGDGPRPFLTLAPHGISAEAAAHAVNPFGKPLAGL